MSLRTRMMIAFAYLLLLVVVALSIPLGISVARRARNDFAVEMTNRAEAVALAAPAAIDGGPDDVNDLVRDQATTGRVILVDQDGRLVADSQGYRAVGVRYTYRPEIVEALAGHTTRLVRDYPNAGLSYVVAVPVIEDGAVAGAVRINRKVAEVDVLVRRRLIFLGGVSLSILLVALVVSAAIARSLTKPLHRLADVAREIGEGDLAARAPMARQPEVAEVTGALNAMTERIEQTMTAQTDFVANASHQLRTPLTGLRLRLEALESTGAPGATAALAETDRLAGLVDDLLVLVRSGTAPTEPETVDLAAAAQYAVDRWSIQATERDHLLTLQTPDDPQMVTAGGSDVAIILDNLIENALKYTPASTTIAVTVAPEGDCIGLTVADDGPGMTPDDSPRVFERFYRGSAGKGVPGTGLGLAIVHQIAQRWDAAVDLDTSQGTRVRIYFWPASAEAEPTEQLAGITSAGR
jgi:signal transduction histidine kinase